MPISVHSAMFGLASQSVARKPRPMLCSASLTRAGYLEHQAEAGADDDLGDHVRDEDQDADEGPAADLLVQQQREADRQRPLNDEGQHDDQAVMLERLLEGGVGENDLVVAQSDPVGGRAVALPLVEAVVRGERDREDHEPHEHDDRGAGEERDFKPQAHSAAALARTRRRGRGVHRVPDLRCAPAAAAEGRGAQGMAHPTGQPFAAASVAALTMPAGVPLPAIRFTTAAFSALPTFWPYCVSRNCIV